MAKKENIEKELTKINVLLRDAAFAAVVAGNQEANYYKSRGQKAPAFFEGPDSLVKKCYREEKIAINLSGFYAVECGVAALFELKGKTPVYWLQQVVTHTLDADDAQLLNRFANATWKAAQPFRSLNRIKKDNFIIWDFLSTAEIQKDADQIVAAASFLFNSLSSVANEPVKAQLEKIDQLLKDRQYALEMARHLAAAYCVGQHRPVPLFLSPAEDTAVIQKSAKEEKIAVNIAGFYAMECGVSYLSAVQNKLPSDLLKSIVNDSLSQKDKSMLERLANATWKTGQPFRSLDRITRDIFMPFDLLPKEEVKKDWDQIQSAAGTLLKSLNTTAE